MSLPAWIRVADAALGVAEWAAKRIARGRKSADATERENQKDFAARIARKRAALRERTTRR